MFVNSDFVNNLNVWGVSMSKSWKKYFYICFVFFAANILACSQSSDFCKDSEKCERQFEGLYQRDASESLAEELPQVDISAPDVESKEVDSRCKSDENCDKTEICDVGECKPRLCKKWQDCPVKQRCKSEEGICEASPPCLRDEDCLGNRICDQRSGECVLIVP